MPFAISSRKPLADGIAVWSRWCNAPGMNRINPLKSASHRSKFSPSPFNVVMPAGLSATAFSKAANETNGVNSVVNPGPRY